jgi:hypothetical protein
VSVKQGTPYPMCAPGQVRSVVDGLGRRGVPVCMCVHCCCCFRRTSHGPGAAEPTLRNSPPPLPPAGYRRRRTLSPVTSARTRRTTRWADSCMVAACKTCNTCNTQQHPATPSTSNPSNPCHPPRMGRPCTRPFCCARRRTAWRPAAATGTERLRRTRACAGWTRRRRCVWQIQGSFQAASRQLLGSFYAASRQLQWAQNV